MNNIVRVWTTAAPLNLEMASKSANSLTKRFNQYCTTVKVDGHWFITNQFDPRVEK